MGRVQVVDYEVGRKAAWDDFVARAKNGVFLFQRDYIEYHADRFADNSLMFYNDQGQLLALLPATVSGDILSSHAGLTFGGVISDTNMKVGLMLEVFDAARAHFENQGIANVIYKAAPHIYHLIPAEEDLYALFRNGARLFRRDVSSTIQMTGRLPFTKGRRYAITLASRRGLEVKRSFDFKTFMAIEEEVLQTKHAAKPVHSTAEIVLLAERFPENIKLFAAYKEQEMLAGVIIYESRQVAHAQYIGVTDDGRSVGALDVIMSHLINEYYAEKKYLDFGTSTEDDGRKLNAGLIGNKQSFGGRAVVYDFYEMKI